MEAERMREYYTGVEDPRYRGFVEHKLGDILILVQCAVMCGLDKLEDIEEYGKSKREWLKEVFGIERVPSDSTLSRVLNMLNPETVVNCVVEMMKEELGTKGEQIALDGKTICSTATEATKQERIHIVTMYMTENRVVLGQKAVPDKTNEIPVVRELLELFNLAGKVITADAMHCNPETVEKIIRCGGDYVLALKRNQQITHEEIAEYIEDCIADPQIEVETADTFEKNRDRLETRICYKAPTLDWFASKEEWAGLKSAYAIRRIIVRDGTKTTETAYVISSLDASPARILGIVRNHWNIESMHWMLDVDYGEDECRLLSPNGHQIMNILRKNAIAFHRRFIDAIQRKTKPSVKKHMLRSLINNDTLLAVLVSDLLHPMK
jgi:predicted transposase YbfD/YdcC